MIIECLYCEAKVDGKVIAAHVSPWGEDYPFDVRTSLIECPACNNALLASQELYDIGPDKQQWSKPIRSWPQPDKYPDWNLPELVQSSLEEARKCYKAKAYSACAVMCGRVLEAICREYKIKKKFLRGGLKELLDKQIIDNRIYEWGEALREYRNIGAHATTVKISKEEAEFLLDFANAICDYVFVLTKKFGDFMKKREK